jgi:hypothetical protein
MRSCPRQETALHQHIVVWTTSTLLSNTAHQYQDGFLLVRLAPRALGSRHEVNRPSSFVCVKVLKPKVRLGGFLVGIQILAERLDNGLQHSGDAWKRSSDHHLLWNLIAGARWSMSTDSETRVLQVVMPMHPTDDRAHEAGLGSWAADDKEGLLPVVLSMRATCADAAACPTRL